MTKNKKWIGVDLDGTLAKYDGWKGINNIGEPYPMVLKLIKEILEIGEYDIKIFTARVSEGEAAIIPIKKYCLTHIGQELEITNVKDFSMIELWDDRCVRFLDGKICDQCQQSPQSILSDILDRDNLIKEYI